jgi:hypothetical protein
VTDFHGDEEKRKKNLEKKIKMATQKKRVFQNRQWIGSWVGRIDLCKGH